MSANLENTAMDAGLEKVIFHSSPQKGNAKECSNYCTIVLISHAIKVCSKSFKLGFSSRWNENFQMYKLCLDKAKKPEIKLPTFIGL